MSFLAAALASVGAMAGKYALEKLLPKLLGLLGDGLVAYLGNFVDEHGKKLSVQDGAELAKKLQHFADRIVRNVEREMPEATGKAKRDEAFLRLINDVQEFKQITVSSVNLMIETAVQKLSKND